MPWRCRMVHGIRWRPWGAPTASRLLCSSDGALQTRTGLGRGDGALLACSFHPTLNFILRVVRNHARPAADMTWDAIVHRIAIAAGRMLNPNAFAVGAFLIDNHT